MVDLESWGAGFENLTKLFFRRGSIITPFSETVHKYFSRVSHIFYHFSNVRAPSRGVNKVNKWKVRIWFYYSARVLDFRLLLDRPPYSQLFQKILS